MDQKSLLEVLQEELPDIQSEVIEEIIASRKSDKRKSQKTISEQFEVPKKVVKKICDRMKEFKEDDLDPTQSTTTSEKGEIGDGDKDATRSSTDFSSMDELKQFFSGLENLEEATASGAKIHSSSLADMLSESEFVDMTSGNPENLNPGDKLINHVKWYVNEAGQEITSLRADIEMFETEKSNLNDQIYKKDQEIAKLTRELKEANELRKSVLCSRCNEPKKYGVAGMNFCGVLCIRKAFIDLRGADELINE